MAEIQQLIRLDVDKASQQRAIRAIEQVEKAGREIGSGFADGARRANRALRDIETDTARVRRERFEGVENIGERTSALAGGFAGGGELGNILGLIGDVGAAFKGLEGDASGAALSVAGLSIGTAALSAALTFYNSQNEIASQSIRGLIDTQEEYYRVLRTGTTEQLRAAIEAQQIEVDITRARIEENRRVFAQFEQEAGALGRAFVDVTNLAGARTLREETQKLESQLGTQEFLLRRYQSALENNETATNDVRAAEEELTRTREASLQSFNQGILGFARDAVAISNELDSTSEQTQARIEDTVVEMNYLKEAITNLEAAGIRSEAELEPLYDRYNDLLDVYARLSNDVLPKLIEQEQARDRNQNILDATEALVEAEARLADLRLKDADAAAALTDTITRLQAEAQAEINDVVAESVDRQLDIIQDAKDREADILKRAGRESANAIADRDAKAKYLSDLNAKDELDENKEQLSKQLLAEQDAARKRVKAVQDAAAKSIAAEQRRYQQEDTLRDRAIQQAIVDQTNYQNGLAAITNNGAIRVRNNVTQIFGYMTQIGSAVENYWRQIATNVIQQVAGLPTTPGTITPPTSPSPYGFGGASAEQAVRSIVNDQLSTLYQMAGRAG